MTNRPVHRWFHTLVVTGASLTACGEAAEEPPVVAPVEDAADSATEAAAADQGTVLIDAGAEDASQDVADDYRCCIITK